MARISSLQQLREIIPAPSQTAFAKIRGSLCAQSRAFVARSPFLMLATIGNWGIEISQKGGDPGFVEIVDQETLLIPEYRGNQFALALGNIVERPEVGLAFIRPGTDEVLRVSGSAELLDDIEILDRLSSDGKSAVLAIRVAITRAAFHCVRSARRAGLWRPETWDEAQRISFGRIYAESLQRPDVEELFDGLTEHSNSTLY